MSRLETISALRRGLGDDHTLFYGWFRSLLARPVPKGTIELYYHSPDPLGYLYHEQVKHTNKTN